MRLIPRMTLIVAVAAVAFPLSNWMTETFHVDCARESSTKFGCVVESSKRGSTQLYKLDETSLITARLDREAHYDTQDHSTTYTYHLALVQPKTAIRSHSGDHDEIKKRVGEINAFLASPEQPSVRFTHNNRTLMLIYAAMMVAATVLFTHDFSYKPKRTD